MHHRLPRLASWVSSAEVAGNLHFTTRTLFHAHPFLIPAIFIFALYFVIGLVYVPYSIAHGVYVVCCMEHEQRTEIVC